MWTPCAGVGRRSRYGRWGHSEVEFGVASLEEIPDAIGLIRQSLER
jgi:predicted transport protein